MSKFTLSVNGQSRTVDVAPETPLLWVLRDQLDLVGTKFGCGVGMCGACTVHLNDSPVRGCQAGQIMSAAALLRQKPQPTDAEIDAAMAGNLCRCATYTRIRAGIHRAAELAARQGGAG
jgi:isoquinoline 1-oxidoreductase subunit alpha